MLRPTSEPTPNRLPNRHFYPWVGRHRGWRRANADNGSQGLTSGYRLMYDWAMVIKECPACAGSGKVEMWAPEELLAARRSNGITLRELGRELGLTPQYLNDLERGHRAIRDDLAVKWVATCRDMRNAKGDRQP